MVEFEHQTPTCASFDQFADELKVFDLEPSTAEAGTDEHGDVGGHVLP